MKPFGHTIKAMAESQWNQAGGPILIFDGDCAMCSRAVRFVLRHERAPVLRFAPLHAEKARTLLTPLGFDPDSLNSISLIEDDRVLLRSQAVLRLAGYLRPPWCWARIFGLLPRFVLDAIYRIIAANRYRILGKVDRCKIDKRISARTI